MYDMNCSRHQRAPRSSRDRAAVPVPGRGARSGFHHSGSAGGSPAPTAACGRDARAPRGGCPHHLKGGRRLMAAAIQIQGLTKKYLQRGEVVAVDNLTLDVEEGEIFGFLGPNGAGKTTTIKMLLGLIFPTSGTATMLGRPIGDVETRRQVSYLPESPYFYDHLTGGELLDFFGRLFGIEDDARRRKVDELMDL